MKMTLDNIEVLAQQALIAAGADECNAKPLARAIASAEGDDMGSHGLLYLPVYCLHLQCGKVNPHAQPKIINSAPSGFLIDADNGFAHRAIDMGIEKLAQMAHKNGIACMGINNSYNCGVLGYHTERISAQQLVALGFTNSPKSIAPYKGSQAVIGTNPFSLAIYEDDTPLLVIDQSASVVAKSIVMKRAKNGQPIPEGWVLDSKGNPTTDPQEGLKGSMVPSGGYKGFSVGLLVEVLAACMTGANLGLHAAPFGGDTGGPPATGQFFIAIDPQKMAGNSFYSSIKSVLLAMEQQENVQIPGQNKWKKRQESKTSLIEVDDDLLAKIKKIIA